MYSELKTINSRPKPFQYYTAEQLWTENYVSTQMLKYHLDGNVDISSRNSKFIKKSIDWISSYFKITSTTKIIDFGCGPGLYTTKLAEKGANVTGIDFSKRSINYAKKCALEKKLKIKYINQNYLNFVPNETYDLIIMIMCDYCALSPNQRKIVLKKFNKLLNPDGKILLDVYTIKAF